MSAAPTVQTSALLEAARRVCARHRRRASGIAYRGGEGRGKPSARRRPIAQGGRQPKGRRGVEPELLARIRQQYAAIALR